MRKPGQRLAVIAERKHSFAMPRGVGLHERPAIARTRLEHEEVNILRGILAAIDQALGKAKR